MNISMPAADIFAIKKDQQFRTEDARGAYMRRTGSFTGSRLLREAVIAAAFIIFCTAAAFADVSAEVTKIEPLTGNKYLVTCTGEAAYAGEKVGVHAYKGKYSEVLAMSDRSDIIKDENGFDVIHITLKYGKDKNEKIITGLKRISKPGLRVYAARDELPRVLGGLGVAIISTDKGVITDKEARAQGVGGEVLCYIW